MFDKKGKEERKEKRKEEQYYQMELRRLKGLESQIQNDLGLVQQRYKFLMFAEMVYGRNACGCKISYMPIPYKDWVRQQQMAQVMPKPPAQQVPPPSKPQLPKQEVK